jgi:RND superfamily putative drug exporter
VVLPVKALLMNVLSLTASFGAIVWIFQDGHLSGLLDFTPTGTLEATQPILVLAVVFGLSMDYEVFLMSRIREHYLRTGDNTAAVAAGLQRTGAMITTAALLLVVVIGAFSLSGITFIKLIGVAMAIAIVVDATVVRALLVPASMRLLGRWNWWAPAPLRRLHDRIGFGESDPAIGSDRDGTLDVPVGGAGNRRNGAEVVQ